MFFFNFDNQPLNLIGVKVVHTGKCKLLVLRFSSLLFSIFQYDTCEFSS